MEFTNGDVADAAVGNVSDVTLDTSNTDTSGTDNSSDGINPSWNEILDALPTSLHPVVIPSLQKWDQGVQKRFETVQSQYAPYKSFAEQGINPQELEASYALYNLMNQNPRFIYDKMVEHYGSEWGLSGQGQPNDNVEDDYSNVNDGETPENNNPYAGLEKHPMFQQLQQQTNTVATYLAAQEEAKVREQAASEVDREINSLHESYGKLEPKQERIILSLALQNNMTLADAAKEYLGDPVVQAQQARNSNLPPVVPTSGGIPMESINPAELSSRDTRTLVAQFLANAKTQP